MGMAMGMVTKASIMPKRPEALALPFEAWIKLSLTTLVFCSLVSEGLAQSVMRAEAGVSSRITFTDNVGASEDANSDFIFEVSPTLNVSRAAGRLAGSMNAAFRNVMYVDESDRNTSFLAFRGQGQFEAIEDLLFVDALGVISRDNLAVFSGRSRNDSLNTSSNDETRTFSISPRLEFRFGDTAAATLRYRSQWLSGADNVGGGDQHIDTWSANASDGRAFGPLGWFVDYQKRDTQYSEDVRDVSSTVGRVGASYTVTPQFVLRASVGRESNTFGLSGRDEGNTHGLGFDWFPTPRTSLTAFSEKRLFGRGYDVQFLHRARRSAWRLSYVRDFSAADELFEGSAEDYFFNLFTNSGKSETDARNLVSDLGIAGSGAQIGFFSNTQLVTRRLAAEMSMSGVRDTLTLSLYRTESSRFAPDVAVIAGDQFSSFDRIRDIGGGVSLNRRISETQSATVALTHNRASGEGTVDQDNRRTTISVGVDRALGPKSSGSLIYRHQTSSGTSDFTENSVAASFSMMF